MLSAKLHWSIGIYCVQRCIAPCRISIPADNVLPATLVGVNCWQTQNKLFILSNIIFHHLEP